MSSQVCVIYNPHSGRGQAARRLAQLQRDWAGRAEFWPTQRPGHAEELAVQAVQAGFRVVAAAGGDGTVHEVANGLLSASQPTPAFAVIPIGSANDYAFSLNAENENANSPPERLVDVGVVRDGTGRQRYFVCCLGLGFNGMVTLEARRIRRLQGMALYGMATLQALWRHYACPALDLSIDDEPFAGTPTLMLSVLVGRREGGFVLAPNARLDDGLFDYVHAGQLSRWEVLKLLPRLALAGPPKEHPRVKLGQCRSIRLRSHVPLVAHTDGEFFARPEDRILELEIRIVPRVLRVRTLPAIGDI